MCCCAPCRYTNCLRFADILGLHLSDVKTFKDEVPVIPRSAFQDLVIPHCPSMATVKSLVATHRETQNVTVVPMFDHQAAATSFSTRLTSQKVIGKIGVVAYHLSLTIRLP